MRHDAAHEHRAAASIEQQIQKFLPLVAEKFPDLFAPAGHHRFDPEPVKPGIAHHLLCLGEALAGQPRAQATLVAPGQPNHEDEAKNNNDLDEPALAVVMPEISDLISDQTRIQLYALRARQSLRPGRRWRRRGPAWPIVDRPG